MNTKQKGLYKNIFKAKKALKNRKPSKNKPLRAVMTREIGRNMIRNSYGNKKVRRIWAEMRIKSIGIVAYLKGLIATDPKQRRSANKYPELPRGSYAHDRAQFKTIRKAVNQ
jgi:hypothetical protein